MPTISLRLSDEQRDELETWARGSERSIQREVVYRLFSMEHVPRRGGAGAMIPAHTSADDHFKPDPKPTSAPKPSRRR
jgi:hypothetical protein